MGKDIKKCKYLCTSGFCRYGTNNRRLLNSHVFQWHTKLQKAKRKSIKKHKRKYCPVRGCDYATKSGNLDRHMTKHNPKKKQAHYKAKAELMRKDMAWRYARSLVGVQFENLGGKWVAKV